MLRVGVRFPPATGRAGDYLADVIALEAAGADSVWLDATAASTEPWILLGAMAAVTHRIRLGATVGAEAGWQGAVDTLARFTSDRVIVGTPPHREVNALIDELKSSGRSSVLLVCAGRDEAEKAAPMADGVILAATPDEVQALRSKEGDFEVWVDLSVPADKVGWVKMVSDMESAGATGIIVPWTPRLIDLLRSAGEPDDRTDLLIATG
jgi:imidazole glycerol phosphate synthase subunit HisF